MARRPYLLTSAACAALAAAIYLIAIHVEPAQRVDLHVLEDAMRHQTTSRVSFANDVIGFFEPVPVMLMAGALVGGALLAGRVRAAAAAAILLAGANVTTELLKPLLATQRPFPAGRPLGPEAYPSGHTTAIVSLLLALVIVLPPRLRVPAAVLGGAAALVALGSIELLGFHYPSDVLGGILVASGWAAAAVAVTGSGRAPTAARGRLRSLPGP